MRQHEEKSQSSPNTPPLPGWYLPPVATRKAELESFDFVDGLVIRGGIDVMVLNGVNLDGGLCSSWVESALNHSKSGSGYENRFG